jgi:hypothetical protein
MLPVILTLFAPAVNAIFQNLLFLFSYCCLTATVTQMSFDSTSGTTTSSERIGSTKPNVTVIYANVTAAAAAESETPGVVPIVESWLEEDVHTVDEQPMTSIPSTSASTVITTTQTSAPSTNSTTTSSTIQSTTMVASTTTKLNSTSLPVLVSNVEAERNNVTFTLLPSSAPSLDMQERLTSAGEEKNHSKQVDSTSQQMAFKDSFGKFFSLYFFFFNSSLRQAHVPMAKNRFGRECTTGPVAVAGK